MLFVGLVLAGLERLSSVQYHLSKLITISPKFVIKNNLDTAIRYREFDVSEASGVVHPGEKVPLYNLTKARLRWLCIQLEQEDQW